MSGQYIRDWENVLKCYLEGGRSILMGDSSDCQLNGLVSKIEEIMEKDAEDFPGDCDDNF